MEEEAMFLFAAYHLEEQPPRFDREYEIRPYSFELRRACMHKRERSGERYSRVHIHFDPLSKQVCYAVVCFFTKSDGHLKFENQPRFVAIEESAEEAEKVKQEMESGGHKSYAENNKEKFVSCEVFTALITPN